ncbi:MAG: 3-deoxy-7-phosphoheptulonate synthase [Chloroflexi bacterium AL-W]|nr:3-deoxy-7-phosphoheptulonate synthase [Chloroflexi bacterium AL-N1]NOK69391.1 3-deoxy-7-phosphoheptulonate synthase [Chloroflexi bacterium AL-N10]NOK76452.1 3-deoxy-7-phosphoheptulonate synthase [Chloroflexi bacterium AL-N5]NOK83569.1 3-deoxy-7-phosphoheptulonate synthase [Chloroflexi bacterium AL-W]NOK91229.1 3-deoxy-7-phosphoheptulonate synthase [Chloroflexi bacterium AL-N15]
MLVVMQANATEEQIKRICDVVVELGYAPHPMPGPTRTAIGITGNRGPVIGTERLSLLPGVHELIRITAPYKLVSREFHEADTIVQVGSVPIGGSSIAVIAGPCTVEAREQVLQVAQAVHSAGAVILRGGAYKPRSSPYTFQGLGEEGLQLLRTAREMTGMPIVTEVMDTDTLPLVLEYADMLQIGARNMQNYTLLKAVGRTKCPVLLKRGFAATIKDLLLAAEYILDQGNDNVVLCERGIRTFDDSARFTLDLGAIPTIKQLSHLPVIVDPSHAMGHADGILPLARAAIAAGADGLIVEVHHDPPYALCDGEQALVPESFQQMMIQLERVAAAVDRSLLSPTNT